MRGLALLGVAFMLLVAVGTFLRGVDQGAASRSPSPRPAATFAWSPPSGFVKSGEDVAWRWAEKGEFKCEIAPRCWGMFVIAQFGCPSGLYVELTTMNGSGNAVGYANDAVGSLSAGQQANLVFDTFDDDATQARMTAINCY